MYHLVDLRQASFRNSVLGFVGRGWKTATQTQTLHQNVNGYKYKRQYVGGEKHSSWLQPIETSGRLNTNAQTTDSRVFACLQKKRISSMNVHFSHKHQLPCCWVLALVSWNPSVSAWCPRLTSYPGSTPSWFSSRRYCSPPPRHRHGGRHDYARVQVRPWCGRGRRRRWSPPLLWTPSIPPCCHRA